MYNLSDPAEVEKAKARDEERRKQELNDIRTVLANASGRRLIWKVLTKCNAFGSVFSKEASTMSYLSGQQDLGHYIMSEIVQADENLLLKMMKENKQRGMK